MQKILQIIFAIILSFFYAFCVILKHFSKKVSSQTRCCNLVTEKLQIQEAQSSEKRKNCKPPLSFFLPAGASGKVPSFPRKKRAGIPCRTPARVIHAFFRYIPA